MPYNFSAECFHTKKLCSRLSSRKAQFFIRKMEKNAFGATYDVHLRLIGKLVGDSLLVIIELFSLGAFVLSQYTRLTDGQTDIISRQQYRAYASQSHGKNRPLMSDVDRNTMRLCDTARKRISVHSAPVTADSEISVLAGRNSLSQSNSERPV